MSHYGPIKDIKTEPSVGDDIMELGEDIMDVDGAQQQPPLEAVEEDLEEEEVEFLFIKNYVDGLLNYDEAAAAQHQPKVAVKEEPGNDLYMDEDVGKPAASSPAVEVVNLEDDEPSNTPAAHGEFRGVHFLLAFFH